MSEPPIPFGQGTPPHANVGVRCAGNRRETENSGERFLGAGLGRGFCGLPSIGTEGNGDSLSWAIVHSSMCGAGPALNPGLPTRTSRAGTNHVDKECSSEAEANHEESLEEEVTTCF